MAWLVVGTAVASAALGAAQAAQQRKAQQQQNQQAANVSAAQTQFSPWTGVKPQQFNPQAVTATELGGGATGALGGAMQGLAIQKSMAQNDALKQQADAAKAAEDAAATKLGPQDPRMQGYDPRNPRA